MAESARERARGDVLTLVFVGFLARVVRYIIAKPEVRIGENPQDGSLQDEEGGKMRHSCKIALAALATTVIAGRAQADPPHSPITQSTAPADGPEGTTLLNIDIATDGTVKSASVLQSSGSQKLDDASIHWIKSHWRWKPPVLDGVPTEAHTTVTIRWGKNGAASPDTSTPNAPVKPYPAKPYDGDAITKLLVDHP